MTTVSALEDSVPDYGYSESGPTFPHAYLMPAVRAALAAAPAPARLFDLGCGNGAAAAAMAELGYSVAGVDSSRSGIAIAAARNVGRFEVRSAYDALAEEFGLFDIVLSLEVIEHLYDPRAAVRTVAGLLAPGGVAIISTPYHGYLKNLAISIVGGWDRHFTALWAGGHIKFWSRSTLRQLFAEAGMEEVRFARVGRVAPLAKSMVAVFRASAGAAH